MWTECQGHLTVRNYKIYINSSPVFNLPRSYACTLPGLIYPSTFRCDLETVIFSHNTNVPIAVRNTICWRVQIRDEQPPAAGSVR